MAFFQTSLWYHEKENTQRIVYSEIEKMFIGKAVQFF